MTDRTAFRTCPLCEAGCGLEIELTAKPDGSEEVRRIRGDMDDVFSAGFLCPKGSTLKHLHEDPDWLREPQVKRDGRFVPATWDEAFEAVAAGLKPVIDQHGRDAVAIYLGNPNAHSLAPMFYNRTLIRSMGTRNRFSASTVDQRPKEISAAMMFGSVAVPVPDLDRTDYLLMLGANPLASNGSLCTAPDFPGRMKRIQERGGSVVVVDPRRSETAEVADRHLAIRPNGDAYFLAALSHELLDRGPGPGRVAAFTSGLDQLLALFAPFTPATVEARTGLTAAQVERVADELIASPTAAVYGRIGTTCQEFGTLSSWLVDVVNLLSGNLDRDGGAMFATGAAGQPSTQGEPGKGRGFRMGRAVSRVSQQPECFGEFPVTALPEEIETPGDGQVRALVTVGGNPVSSNPNSGRLDAAIRGLDFMVSVDPYINETTRHANVILPPPSPLQKSHYDLALLNFAVHNVANYSPPVLPLEETQMDEGQILLRLAAVFLGEPASGPAAKEAAEALDLATATAMAGGAVKDGHGKVADRSAEDLLKAVGERTGSERLLDITLRTGPFGDGFDPDDGGLSLAALEASPHGVDLGPLEANRLPGILRTESGTIELLNDQLLSEIGRLTETLQEKTPEMMLVGRRHVRSNNSWMHNVRVLTKGKNRCTMQIHPQDAERLGISDGAAAKVVSRVGELVIDAECTDVVRPGVISIPHGFGQNAEGVQLRVASEYRGVNTNLVTDEYLRDPISGNIALNGVPVTVAPA